MHYKYTFFRRVDCYTIIYICKEHVVLKKNVLLMQAAILSHLVSGSKRMWRHNTGIASAFDIQNTLQYI